VALALMFRLSVRTSSSRSNTTLSISVKVAKYVKSSRQVQPQQSRCVRTKYALVLSRQLTAYRNSEMYGGA